METKTYKGYDINIECDEYAESPREWDNLGKMLCFHNRYDLGDKKEIDSNDFNGWEEIAEYLKKEYGAIIILPLWLYDHSGISMKTSRHGQHSSWDCGQVGFIYATREIILKEYNCKKVTKKIIEKVENILLSEVEVYSDYLEGNIYHYNIEDIEGENVDSCGGFYGYDHEKSGLMEYAKNVIDCDIEQKRKEKQKKVKSLIKNSVELSYR